MLCKQNNLGMFSTDPGYDLEKVDKIRNKIRIVFGSDCAMDDYELMKRYTLTKTGELVMMVRGFY